LGAPRYAQSLREQGIEFVAAPRHANIILMTGAMTRKASGEVLRYLDGIPEPRVIVAVGDCAINGGVFSGSPDLVTSAAEEVDAHVEIGGCPPAPEAIITAIGEAARLLIEPEESGETDETGADETEEPAE
jgi:Ni,Fe-hydrogenase III small subunit